MPQYIPDLLKDRSNGYVFSVEDENLLFEPHGDASMEFKSYIDQLGEIQSAILPMSSLKTKLLPIKVLPSKIDKILKDVPSI